MVGSKRFALALQAQGRKSVEADWQIISQFPNFRKGFKAIANIAAVAGWGDWQIVSHNSKKKQARFRAMKSWEGRYQTSLGVCWGSGMLAGKLAGYCSKLFKANCWAEQTSFICKGDPSDEFIVMSSERSIEQEIEGLLKTDKATRADMAVALQKLRSEVRDRQQAESDLFKSEERFRSLVETTSDWIWEVDIKGRYTYCSPKIQELLGYTCQEIIGKTPFDFMDKDEAKKIRKKFKKITKTAGPFWNLENRNRHKNGHEIIMETSGVPLFDDKGKLIGYRGIDRDITERKKTEENIRELIRVKARVEVERAKAAELAQAYKELQDMQDKLIRTEKLAVLGKLAGTIAHELRSPLGSIQNVSYFLNKRMTKIQDEKIRKHLRILQDEVKTADTVINNVLIFGRDQKPVLSKTDINLLIQTVLGRMRVPADIRIIRKLSPGLPLAFVGKDQIKYVLQNILSNAIQAMPRGGKLTVASYGKEGAVHVAITDTGSGIAKENLEKIFEPLFSTRANGVGLGLSICRSIMADNGGRIAVKSIFGKGSTFTVHLPVPG